jgi:hypothetical protein
MHADTHRAPPRKIDRRFLRGALMALLVLWSALSPAIQAIGEPVVEPADGPALKPSPYRRPAGPTMPAVAPLDGPPLNSVFAPNVITLGTPKEKVDSLLGSPMSGWIINCLGRTMFAYADGTKLILVGGRVISAVPGGLAVGTPEHGFTIEHQGRQILIEPMILCGFHLDGPMGEVKEQVETYFFIAPPRQ